MLQSFVLEKFDPVGLMRLGNDETTSMKQRACGVACVCGNSRRWIAYVRSIGVCVFRFSVFFLAVMTTREHAARIAEHRNRIAMPALLAPYCWLSRRRRRSSANQLAPERREVRREAASCGGGDVAVS